jgi:hypothetical protein
MTTVGSLELIAIAAIALLFLLPVLIGLAAGLALRLRRRLPRRKANPRA